MMKERLDIFQDFFLETDTIMPVYWHDYHVGYKTGKEIYLSIEIGELDEFMRELAGFIKSKSHVVMDELYRDRKFFVFVDGTRLYLAYDYATYKFIWMKWFEPDKTMDAMDIHFGVLTYKYNRGMIDDDYLNGLEEYLWHEAKKCM